LNLAYHGARAQNPNFDIALEHDLDSNLALVDVVPQELTRVLLNLIGNGFYAAVHYSSIGHRMKICLQCTSPFMALRDILRRRAIWVAFGAKRTSMGEPWLDGPVAI
jgi:hypothetical protein